MRFNSKTGRAALSARGGHASARYHASTGWAHQRRIAPLAASALARKALIGQLSHTDGYVVEQLAFLYGSLPGTGVMEC
jgi:hypothetical protein